jgi:hypothetical protein
LVGWFDTRIERFDPETREFPAFGGQTDLKGLVDEPFERFAFRRGSGAEFGKNRIIDVQSCSHFGIMMRIFASVNRDSTPCPHRKEGESVPAAVIGIPFFDRCRPF